MSPIDENTNPNVIVEGKHFWKELNE